MARVVVTGVGVISSIGSEKEEFWESLVKGRSGLISFDEYLNADKIYRSLNPLNNLKARVVGPIKQVSFDQYFSRKDFNTNDPFSIYARYTTKKAITDSGLDITKDIEDPYRAGVYMGTGLGGIDSFEKALFRIPDMKPDGQLPNPSPRAIPLIIPNIAAGNISIDLGFLGASLAHVSACASGAHAIGEAFHVIRRGDADIMVAGGSEASLTSQAISAFAGLKAMATKFNDCPQEASRPFDKDRNGFVISEGAATLILEEYEHAKKRGAYIYGEIAGYFATSDAFHPTAPHQGGVRSGECIKRALQGAKVNPEDVDYINAHGTSTELNDVCETKAIKLALGNDTKVPISSIKALSGHSLGAAGAIEAVSCLQMIQNQYIIPTYNYQTPDPQCDLDYVPNHGREKKLRYVVSNSLGFGGHNSCLIFKSMES